MHSDPEIHEENRLYKVERICINVNVHSVSKVEPK